ncbi:unnamed protein product [Cylindrotheca closterium]|uniref:Uncharacterized protein n=1 Tax=Cylindrotheca closterium TaxID=2856 RepID=A0AAD2PU29_9STRA|nr:unnamed protein product [Cylindrotheca closterium]
MCGPTESLSTADLKGPKEKADIYLSCDEPSIEFAETLKKEIESRCNLSVALDRDDSWEEDSNDCAFLEHMHQAKVMVPIVTEHVNITAWIMDYRPARGLTAQQALAHRLHYQRCCKPPAINFSKSYKEGLREFMDIVKRNTGSRRFRKPNKVLNRINTVVRKVRAR